MISTEKDNCNESYKLVKTSTVVSVSVKSFEIQVLFGEFALKYYNINNHYHFEFSLHTLVYVFVFTYLIVVYLFTPGGGDAGEWRYIREREDAVANGSKWRVSTITFYSK